MFFLSASANIIIYALVSAFFVVCLQLKSESIISEIIPTVHIVVIHEPEQTEIGYKYLAYYTEQVIEKEPECKYCDAVDVHFNAPSVSYDNPDLTGHSLRAPPCLIF